MSYESLNYSEVESVAGSMHFLRDPLGCENLGITVIDTDSSWEGKTHDHADGEHEEVYFLAEGKASMEVEGEEIELREGDAVRVSPDVTRQVKLGDEGSKMIIVGAP